MATMDVPSLIVLQQRIEDLKTELKQAQTLLQERKKEGKDEYKDDDHNNNKHNSNDDDAAYDIDDDDSIPAAALVEKKGYLFQWQDNSIGWGGIRWNLVFCDLQRGRLAIFESHMDESPVSVLTLMGCAVQDEGVKRNRRYKQHHSSKEDPPLETPGAYFHVLAIYHRPESDSSDDEDDGNDDDDMSSSQRQRAKAAAALPLLRFSTTSLAEKVLWMELISQMCAYCETDEFLKDEAQRAAEAKRQREEQANMAMAMPGASKGTLPPLYFAPADPPMHKPPPPPHHQHYTTTTTTKMPRRRSNNHTRKILRSSSFRSGSKTEDADKREAQYPPSKPMHTKSAPSFLSAEAAVPNYRGLFNLAMILLIVSNFRLIVDTIRANGIVLLNTRQYVEQLFEHYAEDPWHDFPFVTGFLVLQGFIIMAYIIEWLLSREYLTEHFGMALHGVNMHSTLLVSMSIVWFHIDSPGVGAILLLNGVITWMKLISYACANEDYRLAYIESGRTTAPEASLALLSNLEPEDAEISYPKNVTLKNIYYFWLAPTLTYQIAFPRTPRVRVRRVVGILLGLLACVALFTFLVAQIVSPALNGVVLELEKTGGVYTLSIFAEYWLKLAIANTYLWLLMFYTYFHLYLNLWAELLRFGDRVFYKDWWNSSEIGTYWRLWNMPVHFWLVRHIFFPSLRMGVNRTVAVLIVFTVSAILHEVLVSVPFHILSIPWSFIGMMGQVPLVAITKFLVNKNPGSSIGNIVFWLTFCVIGQPMAILMYTADYQYAKLNREQ